MPAPAPLGKYLASSDKKTRDKAMKALTAFICDEGNGRLSKSDMAKLWKGIFYCFWMSDKPLVQQALATDLADILLSIPTLEAVFEFLRGFWEALVREWSGLDRLRLDKYYLLVRRYTNVSFRLLIRAHWDVSACDTYNDILGGAGGPLSPNDSKIPPSLAYHLADIYLEELNKALSSPPESESGAVPLITVLSPFLALLAKTPSNITFQRVETALLGPLLSALQLASAPTTPPRKRARLDAASTASIQPSTENNDPPDVPLYYIINRHRVSSISTSLGSSVSLLAPKDVLGAVLRGIFDVAGDQTTRDPNRRRMYAIWKAGQVSLDEEDDGGM